MELGEQQAAFAVLQDLLGVDFGRNITFLGSGGSDRCGALVKNHIGPDDVIFLPLPS